jgi:hypothetical protein
MVKHDRSSLDSSFTSTRTGLSSIFALNHRLQLRKRPRFHLFPKENLWFRFSVTSLYDCARDYIEKASFGRSTGLEATAEIVLTHPNGWEGGQQELMRQAAIKAGMIPDTPEGRDRLFFVPEGEASLHFCVQNGWITDMKVRFSPVPISSSSYAMSRAMRALLF